MGQETLAIHTEPFATGWKIQEDKIVAFSVFTDDPTKGEFQYRDHTEDPG